MKKKGAALPSAIALCMILLIVSLTVGTFILLFATNNKISQVKTSNSLYYETYNNKFINDEDVALFPTDKVNWQVVNHDSGNIKALIAKNKSDSSILFYSIYDFDHDELLAYQMDEYYMPIDGDYYLLGGLVKIPRS